MTPVRAQHGRQAAIVRIIRRQTFNDRQGLQFSDELSYRYIDRRSSKGDTIASAAHVVRKAAPTPNGLKGLDVGPTSLRLL